MRISMRHFIRNEKKPVKIKVSRKGKSIMKEYAKNTILYGPPGTGKTFHIRNRAVDICLGKGNSESDAPDGNRDYNKEYENLLNQGRIQFVTFHQSYGYEDFIEGIRPVMDNEAAADDKDGELKYTIRDGVFKQFCKSAEEAQKNAQAQSPEDVQPIPKSSQTDDIVIEAGYHIRLMNVSDTYPHDYWLGVTGKKRKCISILEQDPCCKQFNDEFKKGDYVIVQVKNKNNGKESVPTKTHVVGVARIVDEVSSPNLRFSEKRAEWLRLSSNDCDETAVLLKDIEKWFPALDDDFWVCENDSHFTPTIPEQNKEYLTADVKSAQTPEKEKDNTGCSCNCVFIIDEINRGNISKIFGELITLIEDDKRKGAENETKTILPYSGEYFSIPENVYILGTMNTADRSVALLDTALRRRFTFEEMMPKADLLKDLDIEGIKVKDLLEAMNKRIEVLLDREHQIGHAYFLPLIRQPSIEKLEEIFKNRIIPLLQEYFYDDYRMIAMVLNDNGFIEKADFRLSELFDGCKDDLPEPEQIYRINTDAMKKPINYKAIIKKQPIKR